MASRRAASSARMRCASVSSGLLPRSGSLCETMRPRLGSNTSVAWQHGHVTSISDFNFAIVLSSRFSVLSSLPGQNAGESGRPELLLDLDRVTVGLLRRQAQIDDLLPPEIEALAEAGDERI